MGHLGEILFSNSLFSKLEAIDPLILWIGGVVLFFLVVWGIVVLILRGKTHSVRGRKLSFRERLQFRKAQIILTGDKRFKPRIVTVALRNPGKRPVDLQAPILIFKRWSSSRKFRINSFGNVNDFPIWLEPGYEAKWNIELEQFYERVPELRRACRLRAEMREVSGKKFVSRTIRLKWL
jgi:hypothetical protein